MNDVENEEYLAERGFPLLPLTPGEQEAIEEYLSRIHDEFPGRVLSVLLFGSKARGDAEDESDIDLLAVVDTEDPSFRSALWRIASDVSLAHNLVLSVRVYGQPRWREASRLRLPLYRAIVADGVPLETPPVHSG
jgi:predicted nucleotidyltransferase